MRHNTMSVAKLSVEVVEELGLHLVSFDRPGYGESDPHPKRTPESIALDIEELADHLEFGSRFYVMGFSMGGQVIWGCLKYIPHRLAGATLIAPVVNYWWPGFPANLSTEAYYRQLPQDQWTLRVAHHAPWLTYWWNSQKWFPASAVAAGKPEVFSRQDLEILSMVTDMYMFFRGCLGTFCFLELVCEKIRHRRTSSFILILTEELFEPEVLEIQEGCQGRLLNTYLVILQVII
ncbi:HYDROLASE ALPHA/BETA FOLD FAMILY PROTEIN EXPRESSED-RELATED [Salix purpurea]|uniref:HYDROLASE ALPHA/BETA FOLD FAMILY PROTEIN EXPRESSED-RELATED n=1 Tax=Salix purpurea TaxID=77065 RepID=A0A9Q0VQW5_SALPP|nr:HYDROLASE ALPHA/BETA FOLD FAMILY PROTEIN EXPRESSED-RELATED [Salix purpurea]